MNLHIHCYWHAIFRSPASNSRSFVSAHPNRACLERPYNFARAPRCAGIGPGAAAFGFRAGSQIYQNHSLDTQAPCDIHWNLADGTHEQHGPPNLKSDCLSSDEHFQGCSTDHRDAEGSFSSSAFHLSTSALTWRGGPCARRAGREGGAAARVCAARGEREAADRARAAAGGRGRTFVRSHSLSKSWMDRFECLESIFDM